MPGGGAGRMPRGHISSSERPNVGYKVPFADLEYGFAVKNRLSNMLTTARLLLNNSGTVLNPGELVNYEAGFVATQVDALAGALGPWGAVVDDWLPPSGVPNGYYFWGITNGPCRVISASAIALGDNIITAASGKVDNGTGAILTHVGFALEAATGADELIRAFVKNIPYGD